MAQIANERRRFAVTTGDNGYPVGQPEQLRRPPADRRDTSAIFGPRCGGAGQLDPALPGGRQPRACPERRSPPASRRTGRRTSPSRTSGGRYQNDVYCCVNGSAPAELPSAVVRVRRGQRPLLRAGRRVGRPRTPGPARRTATIRSSHWAPTSPEYLWLQADLTAHPSGLKFAVLPLPALLRPAERELRHLPAGRHEPRGAARARTASTSPSAGTPTSTSATRRERQRAGPVSYVTGGGGAQAQSTGTVQHQRRVRASAGRTRTTRARRAAARRSRRRPPRSTTSSRSRSRARRSPSTPTDSTGRTFDVQTYTFNAQPDTFIDSAPPAGTTSTSATFTFHASAHAGDVHLQARRGTAAACTSPMTYTGLDAGCAHVHASPRPSAGSPDPLPATCIWTVDTTAPSRAGAASRPSPVAVLRRAELDRGDRQHRRHGLRHLSRRHAVLASIGAGDQLRRHAVLGASTHQYADPGPRRRGQRLAARPRRPR